MIAKTDAELVTLYLQKKDKKAFGVIYERYFDDVYNFVYSRVGKKDWTEELVSETFFGLMSLIAKFDPKYKLKSFIIGISLNKIKQFWSKQMKDKTTEFDEDFIIIEDEIETNEEMKINTSIITKILSKLPEKYKNVLNLRFLEEMSIKETALKLNLSISNVKVIQNRALKKATYIGNQVINEKN